jgi:hypothetical protein
MDINLITSSCKESDLPKNSDIIISSNWAFLYNVKVDYYLCSTLDLDLLNAIISKKFSPSNWLITQNVLNYFQNNNFSITTSINLFSTLQKISYLGKKHIQPKNLRGSLDLPTTGVQMIYFASSFKCNSINIFGINLYTKKVTNGGYKEFGTTYLENPYIMNTKPHSFKTDLMFIFESFHRCIKNKIKINADSEILNDSFNLIKLNKSYEYCLHYLNKKYYNNE